MIKKEGEKWILYTKDGSKRLGEHGSKESALKQDEAIRASESSRNSAILVSNVDGKSQIRAVDGKWIIKKVPICADNAVMNSVFYPADENKKGLPSMVGKPFTLGHPEDGSGAFISAREGDGLMKHYSGGVVTKAYNERGVSYADLMIDQATLKAQDKEGWMVDMLESKKDLGVSTGLFFDANEMGGDGYSMTAINQSFDHLAGLHPDEAPAGGEVTVARFNSDDASRVAFVNQHLPKNETLLNQAIEAVKALFDSQNAESYNVEDGSHDPATNQESDNGSDAVDRKMLEAMAKKAGVYEENMDDDAMYNAIMGSYDKKEEKKEEMAEAKNSDNSEILDAINKLGARVESVEQAFNADADRAHGELSDRVVKLDIGIDGETAKAMSTNALKSVLAKHGHNNFAPGHTPAVNQDADTAKAPWEQ